MQATPSFLPALLIWLIACSPCLLILLVVLLQKEERAADQESLEIPGPAPIKPARTLRARRSLSLLSPRHIG